MKNNPPQRIRSFSVVAHGRSTWLLKHQPTSSGYIVFLTEPHTTSKRTCKNPPSPATPTHESDRDTPLPVAVVITGVLVVVFLVV